MVDCRRQASFLNGGNPIHLCLFPWFRLPFLLGRTLLSPAWRLGSAASPPERHSPVFILCLVTVSNLGFRVQSLSSQISAKRAHMISYWGGWGRAQLGETRRLEPRALPRLSWCPSQFFCLPSVPRVIGLLLVSISFGRQVCWGHPQLCQFSHCLSVTFLSFTLPLILHLYA